MKKYIFVSGAAGFIGSQLCERLINENKNIIGLDNINNYYDVKLKEKRLLNIESIKNKGDWKFYKGNIEDQELLKIIFNKYKPKIVVNLAAQAGVRYSLENPYEYINSNIVGFHNIIEYSRQNKVENFIYASSSSIYGGNTKFPFCEDDPVNHPVSLYAATKRSNELIAHSYSHIYGLPCTGLRFFTVYGPWGRPDMAPILFANAISQNKPITIFNQGEMYRDFTYIDDVIEIIYRLIDKPAKGNKIFNTNKPQPSSSWAPYMLFNIGNSNKVKIMEFIRILEKEIGIKAIKHFTHMQIGDVKTTIAETKSIESWVNFRPNTTIELGIKKFIKWYKNYYFI